MYVDAGTTGRADQGYCLVAEIPELINVSLENKNVNMDYTVRQVCPSGIEIYIDGQRYIVKEQPITPDDHTLVDDTLSSIGEHIIFTENIHLLLAERPLRADVDGIRLNTCQQESNDMHRDSGEDVVEEHKELMDDEIVEIEDVVVNVENSAEESVVWVTDSKGVKGQNSQGVMEKSDDQLIEKTSIKNLCCQHCTKTFQKRNSYLRHVLIHTGEKPFTCDICGKGFSQDGHLKVHQRIHNEEKKFSCDVCGKSFAVNSNLKTHKRIHSGEKPYKCDICGMGFNQSSSMKVHRRSHNGEKPFSCDKCGKKFTRRESLRYHQNIHGGSHKFECGICKKKFGSSTYLKRHLTCHSDIKEFGCVFCSKTFSLESNLKTHLRLHSGERVYKCTVCNDKFMHSQTLKIHLQTHGVLKKKLCMKCGLHVTLSCNGKEHKCNVKEKPHFCEKCGKSFGKLNGLKKHMQSHCQGTKITCEVCGKAYKIAESLKNHMKMHGAFLIENEGLVSSNNDLNAQYQNSISEERIIENHKSDVQNDTQNKKSGESSELKGKEEVSCNFNGKDETNGSNYLCHDVNGEELQSGKDTVNGKEDQAYAKMEQSLLNLAAHCENVLQRQNLDTENTEMESGSILSNAEGLHMLKNHETNEEPIQKFNPFIENDSRKVSYICSVCGEAFSQKSQLYKHLPKHTKKKPFSCDICGGGFSQRCHLKVHLRKHSGDKGYSCDVCGKAFTVKSNLKTHMRIHSGEKPYKCDACGIGFNQSSSMKVHRRTHSGEKPFVCDICGKRFTRTENLRSHKKAHRGDRPFKCDLCERAFTNCDYLKLHQLAHSKVKQFVCSICGKRFAWKANLRYHLRTHNKESSL